MQDVRNLIHNEFDVDMLPSENDWAFNIDGFRLTMKQEEKTLALP